MKKISKIILFLLLTTTFLVGCSAESKEKDNITDGEITKFLNNKVELTYNGERVDPLIALVDSEKEVSIKIKFDSENVPKKVDLMNKYLGESEPFTKVDNTTFEITTKLQRGMEYGYLVDNVLTGGIKGLDYLKEADLQIEKKIIQDVLQCGF